MSLYGKLATIEFNEARVERDGDNFKLVLIKAGEDFVVLEQKLPRNCTINFTQLKLELGIKFGGN